jgi:hypothetical protein
MVIATAFAVAYSVLAWEQGGLVNPGAVVIYFSILLASLGAGLVRLAMALLHVAPL